MDETIDRPLTLSMDYSELEYLDVTVDAGIALVRFAGPYYGNAITPTGHREFAVIWPMLEQDDAVSAVLLTGARGTFCDGPSPEMKADMAQGSAAFQARAVAEVRAFVTNVLAFSKPVVCAVNATIKSGSGQSLALLSDVIVAERQVVFVDHHVPAGIAAGDGSILAWPLTMGLLKAKRYLLTGESMTADEAERMGLISEVVDTGASEARAREYAAMLVAAPSAAVRLTKQALNEWYRLALPAFDLGLDAQARTLALLAE